MLLSILQRTWSEYFLLEQPNTSVLFWRLHFHEASEVPENQKIFFWLDMTGPVLRILWCTSFNIRLGSQSHLRQWATFQRPQHWLMCETELKSGLCCWVRLSSAWNTVHAQVLPANWKFWANSLVSLFCPFFPFHLVDIFKISRQHRSRHQN